MDFKPKCMAYPTGGLPHTDIQKACEFIISNTPEFPVLPYLVKLKPLMVNSSWVNGEGVPCLVTDEANEKVYFKMADQKFVDSELEKFYERYFAGDLDYFAISEERAPAYRVILKMIKNIPRDKLKMIRVNVTGPITFGLKTVDENGKPVFYNETMREALVKALTMKVRWLKKLVQSEIPGVPVLLQVAEPLLQMYGSAFVSINKDEVLSCINEVCDAFGDFVSIHCCGNTDWPMLMEAKADCISFDAVEHAFNIALFPEAIKNYLDRGGVLAWGATPAYDDKIAGETSQSLAEKFEQEIKPMLDHGINRQLLLESSFISAT